MVPRAKEARRVRAGLVVMVAAVSLLVSGTFVAADAPTPSDRALAVNVVPPGQSGAFNLLTFLGVTAGTSHSFGPNFADQLPLYKNWQYKAFQFDRSGAGVHPGGRTDVTVYHDKWGVPEIYASSENAMAYALGWSMANDRMFQMEAFRHVGQGTLAALVGPSGIPMDEQTRRVSEGSAARLAELAAAPQGIQDEANQFTAGVNQSMTEQCGPLGLLVVLPSCPAEFTLLGDVPIAHWTNDDTLAFGEYAGRNFGEFDVGETSAASAYLNMVQKLGSQPAAEKAFNDLYALDVPESPHIVSDADGLFPRHLGPPAPGSFAGSPYLNHDPGQLGSAAALAAASTAIDGRANLVRQIAQELGIPRFGSNAIAVKGSRTADGNPILYSGPQTGWAVPGFFWEVELHDPVRDERGVTVPAVPLVVIGRNSDMAWSVTSGTVANASTFDEHLDSSNTHYTYKGHQVPIDAHNEVIYCKNPPSSAASLAGGKLPQLCPFLSETITVYKTVHGPGLADPVADASGQHHLFTRQTTVDKNFVKSLVGWDQIAKTHNAVDFGNALSQNYLGFNFFFAAATGEIAYFHTGRYPIYASNVDPTLPLQGTGEQDWTGIEPYSNNPHVINPVTGYLANWNNKPAKGWWSPSQAALTFGADHHVTDLVNVVTSRTDWTLSTLGQAPRLVAYTDNRARDFNQYLLDALADPSLSGSAAMQTVRQALTTYDFQRTDRGGGRMGPATTFFDRWFEFLTRDVFSAVMDQTQCSAFTYIDCGNPASHYFSDDNGSARAHKLDLNSQDALLRAFRGETAGPDNQYPLLAGVGGAHAVALHAANQAAQYLTAADGANPANWTEPIELVHFSAQGAGSVPDYGPLQNRGSYGQVVEPLQFSVSARDVGAARTDLPNTVLPNTSGGSTAGVVLFALLAAAGAIVAAAARTVLTRRRRQRVLRAQGVSG